MRGSASVNRSRRLVIVAASFLAAALVGALPAYTAANGASIVNGTNASAGEYPAQGYLQIETLAGVGACGGTLVSTRRFLTAAQCVVDGSSVVAPSALLVILGELTITQATVEDDEVYLVTGIEVHEDYAGEGNDVAMLTLDRPAALGAASDHTPVPMRIVRPSETALWEPGDVATIIGWGATSSGGSSSDDLLEAQVPLVSDSDCIADYAAASPPVTIDPDTMVCASDSSAPFHGTCQGDEGGPLMVPDALSALILVGVVSFSIGCADPDFPSVYTRIGAPALNAWVRGRLISVNFSQSPAALTAGQSVTFTGTAEAGGNFTWDLNGDGVFDASGTSVSHAFPAPGAYRVVLRVTDPEGQPAERVRTLNVGAVPPSPPPPPLPPGCTIAGTAGNDVLVGTVGKDVICGLGGSDTIKGLGGNDTLKGAGGNDKLIGGSGADTLLGGAGSDRLTGGGGKDVLKGQGGGDLLLAKDGVKDTVNGGPGGDRAKADRIDRKFSIEKLL